MATCHSRRSQDVQFLFKALTCRHLCRQSRESSANWRCQCGLQPTPCPSCLLAQISPMQCHGSGMTRSETCCSSPHQVCKNTEIFFVDLKVWGFLLPVSNHACRSHAGDGGSASSRAADSCRTAACGGRGTCSWTRCCPERHIRSATIN